MTDWIRSLSVRSEIVIVTVAAFGYFVLASWLSVVDASPPAPWTSADLLHLVTLELILLSGVALFLRVRGWRWCDLTAPASWHDAGTALGLTVAAVLLAVLVTAILLALGSFLPDEKQVFPIANGLGWPAILATSVVNGFYEELFVCAYLMTAIRRIDGRSWWPAIHISTAVRTAYHLYQGGFVVATIIPTGLLFAWVYARTGRLWPLVLAHAILDIWAFAQFA